mgnify:CR=1 FL=1
MKVKNYFKSIYQKSSKLTKILDRQKIAIEKQQQLVEFSKKIASSYSSINQVSNFMTRNIDTLNKIPRQGGHSTAQEMLDQINRISQVLKQSNIEYSSHIAVIDGIADYKTTFESTQAELRLHLDKDSSDKASDLKHKLNLTLLRALQIPVFIFVTYISIFGVVKLLGEKDLIIPRGLISIVPSSLEQNARYMANPKKISDNINTNPSAISKAPATTKSITHSLTPTIKATQTQ